MQYHLNGFKPGDPDISPEAREAANQVSGNQQDAVPADVDVLIVGCGPAGLTLAAQLSAFPDIKTCIVEQKLGPLALGQADGVACRTMEMFEAFGFSAAVMREAYWVNETAFWKPETPNSPKIVRHGRIQDVEDDLSEYPHVILNQARVHDYYLETMRNSPSRLTPHYGRSLTSLSIDAAGDANGATHPVTVTLKREGQPEAVETVRARYVVGCDGARSAVRPSIGQSLRGDSASQAWGVMDVLAVTDFPDIRLKALVQSAGEGSLLIIPREGGYLVRIYVELDKLNANERVAARNITIEKLIAAAQRILKPYTLDMKEVAWWSVYEIGQRLCDKFDDVPDSEIATRLPHVFICGDACHTHSPKAGQGMNVSMQDAFNLGWKLAAVLQGRSPPDLLHSYSAERQAIAAQLIAFDREWAAMLSAPIKTSPGGPGVDPAEVQRYFVEHGRYTAGTATRYTASRLTAAPTHQALATGLEIGTRFHSGPVIRLADGKPMRLGDTLKADGRWRIIAFADRSDPSHKNARLRQFCEALSAAGSPLHRLTLATADIDAAIDVRAVLQQAHRDVDIEAMPGLLVPRKGRHGLKDYEKIFCPDLKSGPDIFDLRGIDRQHGCMVVVRPDQYIADVLPLDGITALSAYFDRIMIAR